MTTVTKQIDSRIASGEGKWLIVTASGSEYSLDLDGMTITRHWGVHPPVDDHIATELRRDGQAIPLEQIITCEVGVWGEFVLNLRGDGIFTYRRTTAIESIQRIPE